MNADGTAINTIMLMVWVQASMLPEVLIVWVWASMVWLLMVWVRMLTIKTTHGLVAERRHRRVSRVDVRGTRQHTHESSRVDVSWYTKYVHVFQEHVPHPPSYQRCPRRSTVAQCLPEGGQLGHGDGGEFKTHEATDCASNESGRDLGGSDCGQKMM